MSPSALKNASDEVVSLLLHRSVLFLAARTKVRNGPGACTLVMVGAQAHDKLYVWRYALESDAANTASILLYILAFIFTVGVQVWDGLEGTQRPPLQQSRGHAAPVAQDSCSSKK